MPEAVTTGATLSRMADAMVMFDGLLHEAGDQVRVRPAADFEFLLTAPARVVFS